MSVNATVQRLKVAIKDKEGIPVDQQRLVFSSACLEDDKTLEHYEIHSESTVMMMLR